MALTRQMERGIEWGWRRVAARYPRLTALRAGLACVYASRTGGLRPENMLWIFGSGRTGSTWLRTMMGDLPRHKVWEEPLVGKLFGEFYENAQQGQLRSKNFVMGGPTREGWIRSVRAFVLDGAQYAHPFLAPTDYLVVKEPNGSAGAPLLMQALPESRMILLIRDPRDVISSTLDAAKRGGWLYEWMDKGEWRQTMTADTKPDSFVKMRASLYLQQVGNAKKAYDAHEGPKAMVKYEDLRADTLGTMRRIYSALGIVVDGEDLIRAVKRHSWENIPEKKKGVGKFYRKGSPGDWRGDLTPGQIETVEQTTSPLLKTFYGES